MDWQDIETAPKDGTAIIVTDGDDEWQVRWSSEPGNSKWPWVFVDELDAVFEDVPTHWKPLSPPSRSAE